MIFCKNGNLQAYVLLILVLRLSYEVGSVAPFVVACSDSVAVEPVEQVVERRWQSAAPGTVAAAATAVVLLVAVAAKRRP